MGCCLSGPVPLRQRNHQVIWATWQDLTRKGKKGGMSGP